MTNNKNLRKVLDAASLILARHHGWSTLEEMKIDCPSFKALEVDEYGWSDNESPIIMWEEGPYEWTFDLPEEFEELMTKNNLFAEPATSWALGLYPN